MRQLTAEIVARQLTELGFPEFFRDVLRGRTPGGLRVYFERPSSFYRLLAEHPQDFPFPDTILPLHESNHDTFVCYVPPPVQQFIKHSIEWSPSDCRVLASTLQEYLTYELKRLWLLGAEPEDVLAFGRLVGYPDIERVVAELEGED